MQQSTGHSAAEGLLLKELLQTAATDWLGQGGDFVLLPIQQKITGI
jgi:hypothetical protein